MKGSKQIKAPRFRLWTTTTHFGSENQPLFIELQYQTIITIYYCGVIMESYSLSSCGNLTALISEMRSQNTESEEPGCLEKKNPLVNILVWISVGNSCIQCVIVRFVTRYDTMGYEVHTGSVLRCGLRVYDPSIPKLEWYNAPPLFSHFTVLTLYV